MPHTTRGRSPSVGHCAGEENPPTLREAVATDGGTETREHRKQRDLAGTQTQRRLASELADETKPTKPGTTAPRFPGLSRSGGSTLAPTRPAAARRRDEGLATGFYSPAPPDELAALATVVGLPDDTALTGIMPLGHAAEDPAVSVTHLAQRRRPRSDLITWLQ